MSRITTSRPNGLFTRISDTIADHPRVSAAAAFQIGALLGQALQNSGALKGIARKMAAAPGAIASSFPKFGFVHDAAQKVPVKAVRAATRRSPAKRSKRTTRTRPA